MYLVVRGKVQCCLVSDDRSLIDNTKVECQFLAQCQCFHYHYSMIQMALWIGRACRNDMQYPRGINNINFEVLWHGGAKLNHMDRGGH